MWALFLEEERMLQKKTTSFLAAVVHLSFSMEFFLALIFYIYDEENRAIHLFLITRYSQVLHYIICHLIYKGYHF